MLFNVKHFLWKSLCYMISKYSNNHCISYTSFAWKKWTILLLQINHNLFCDSVVVERENTWFVTFSSSYSRNGQKGLTTTSLLFSVPADIWVCKEKLKMWKPGSECLNSTKDCSVGSYFLGWQWLEWFVYFTFGIALFHTSMLIFLRWGKSHRWSCCWMN